VQFAFDKYKLLQDIYAFIVVGFPLWVFNRDGKDVLTTVAKPAGRPFERTQLQACDSTEIPKEGWIYMLRTIGWPEHIYLTLAYLLGGISTFVKSMTDV
jgi:hypothetical protein